MTSVFSDQPVSGILCGGMHIGIRKKAKDLAVFYSTTPASFACVSTTNQFAAPPIQYNRKKVQGIAQLIIVNSGNANAATGKQGVTDCKRIAQHAAKQFQIKPEHVALASTGIIGKRLPVGVITNGLARMRLANTKNAWRNAAKAIQTTDQTIKYTSQTVNAARIVGIAKGAGMIHPSLATMLCFLFTDAKLTPRQAHTALNKAVNQSFNRINVDGCQSTNDTVMLMANGLAGNVSMASFQKSLNKACLSLAKAIVNDGEGTQQTFELRVHHAKNMGQASELAKAILNNALVQTAFASKTPNLGRLVAALGSANTKINIERTKIWVNQKCVFKNQRLKPYTWNVPCNPVRIKVDLHQGTTHATFYGCDLTNQYVTLNQAYTP